MIRFSENESLKPYNTFGVEGRARFFFEFTENEDLAVFLNSNQSWKETPLLVLGGGSNLLFVHDFEGLVIHPNLPGIRVIREDRQHVWMEIGAGEIWDDFVKYTVDYEAGGIENLSFIPGTVGAAPVQNIGAYGQEVSHVIETVKGYDLKKNQPAELPADACAFAYRDSIFKRALKNRFIITSVVFKLEKFPEFNLGYGRLEEEVKSRGEPTLQTIREAVIAIRTAKLPDVEETGNAGSFFKNPVVPVDMGRQLKAEYPGLPVFPADDQFLKLAAGWLVEQAGWKGHREGDAGVHQQQALVLVNHGQATGKEIFDLSEKIQTSVVKKFGVALQREVHVI